MRVVGLSQAQKPLGGQRGRLRVLPRSRAPRGVYAFASREATGRQDPGQRLELPGLDRQAARESQEQERSY